MKRVTLLTTALMLSLVTFGQKCRFTVDKKDEFTGEKVNSIVHTNSGWTWTTTKKDRKYLIDMTFLQAGDVEKPMTTHDSIQVKLEDGTIFHLRPVADVAPVGGAVSTTSTSSSTYSGYRTTGRATTSTTNVTSFTPTFEVNRSVFEKLSRSAIIFIRLDFTGKAYDLDFTKKPLSKSAPVLMNNAKCILSLN